MTAFPRIASSAAAWHLFLLFALCALLYLPYLASTPFFDKGEPREAMAVQDIMTRGDWFVPLKRATDIPSKPPLFHWSAALTAKLTGRLSEATIRFPSAFYATLGVLVLYLLGRRLFGGETALLGAAILATTLVYSNQALSARVDMTLCFFVTVSLVMFYALYRGFLQHSLWYYVFYALVGIGTLAKGPLGILLPALVCATFLVIKRRWDLAAKFCLHPGCARDDCSRRRLVRDRRKPRRTTGSLAGKLSRRTWRALPADPAIAIRCTTICRIFFHRDCRGQSFCRSCSLIFSTRNGLPATTNCFLRCGLLRCLFFFSLSVGKRAVYLLPVYPALSILLAIWFHDHVPGFAIKKWLYRAIAVNAVLVGLVLLVITLGALWNHDPAWFFEPIGKMLKPKDRANLFVVSDALANFGGTFTVVAVLSGALWLALAHSLWNAKLLAAAQRLVLISILLGFVTRAIVMPAIAAPKSYKPFMAAVNQRLSAGDQLYLYGEFNSDPIVFYSAVPVSTRIVPTGKLATKIGAGTSYVIMPERAWEAMQKNVPAPILRSTGTGPEGDAPLVLVQSANNGSWFAHESKE